MSTSRRKLGKSAAIQETQEEGDSETPPAQRVEPVRDSQPIDSTLGQNLEQRAQLSKDISNVLGASVQLTDGQFQSLLARLTAQDLRPSILPTQEPRTLQPIDPDDPPSDSSHGSYRPRPLGRHNETRSTRRSPKHEDPDKLDDGVSPTYASWCILLEGKLEANADWWATEQLRINYVFSCTKGKAQEHLEPRMSRRSANRWTSVDQILDHLDIIFRDHFEKDRAQDQYTRLIQQDNEDFNDFHAEFARLTALGEISPDVWRADLYRKLNQTLQDRLIVTEHQYPSYAELVRECQRINVRLVEYRQRFPRTDLTQRRRPESTPSKPVRHGSTSQLPPGILPAPRRANRPFRALPPARDSTTPGPRPSPAPAIDPSKVTCFNCNEVGHYANACPNPRATPRINEIDQDTKDPSDEANDIDEDDADSESEN
jgi:hypothetical protein